MTGETPEVRSDKRKKEKKEEKERKEKKERNREKMRENERKREWLYLYILDHRHYKSSCRS